MIGNPSIQITFPPTNLLGRSRRGSLRQGRVLIGGRQFYGELVKVLLVLGLVFCASSALLKRSAERLIAEIEGQQASYAEVQKSNTLLKEQRQVMFSLQSVATLAGNELAIYAPGPGQYRTTGF